MFDRAQHRDDKRSFDSGIYIIDTSVGGGDKEEEEEERDTLRRSIHSRSTCERAKIWCCGDERTKESCSGWWIMALVLIYGLFCVLVLLNCSNDRECSNWIAWTVIIVGTIMMIAIAMKCFEHSTASGEIGCSRCFVGFSCNALIQPPYHSGPPFSSGAAAVMQQQQQMGMTLHQTELPPPPPETPMPTIMPVEEQARTRFTLVDE